MPIYLSTYVHTSTDSLWTWNTYMSTYVHTSIHVSTYVCFLTRLCTCIHVVTMSLVDMRTSLWTCIQVVDGHVTCRTNMWHE